MKERIGTFRYFWIGGIMGLAQQLLGRLDYYLYHGHDVFRFSAIMGGFSLYAFIILFVMQRKLPPKRQLRDLFLFFLGLNFFYYLFVFLYELLIFLRIERHTHETAYYFQNSRGEVFDFIKWTVIGTAAGAWAYLAGKARIGEKKALFRLMAVPLFGVILLELAGSSVRMYRYVVQEFSTVQGNSQHSGSFVLCPAAELLTSVTVLVIAGYLYFFRDRKTPAEHA